MFDPNEFADEKQPNRRPVSIDELETAAARFGYEVELTPDDPDTKIKVADWGISTLNANRRVLLRVAKFKHTPAFSYYTKLDISARCVVYTPKLVDGFAEVVVMPELTAELKTILGLGDIITPFPELTGAELVVARVLAEAAQQIDEAHRLDIDGGMDNALAAAAALTRLAHLIQFNMDKQYDLPSWLINPVIINLDDKVLVRELPDGFNVSTPFTYRNLATGRLHSVEDQMFDSKQEASDYARELYTVIRLYEENQIESSELFRSNFAAINEVINTIFLPA